MAKRTPTAARVKGERALTTTSYALLGLLAVQPWSAYEVARQMKRSLRFHWPRAESRIYLELPNLVAHGLATRVEERTGSRKRSVYSITGQGRRALRRWLDAPSAAPQLESEALVRSLFADSGTKDELLRTLREMKEQALEARGQLLRQGAEYLDHGGPFPHRLHLIALNGQFSLSFTKMLADWAQWAEDEVRSWNDTAPLAEADALAVFRAVIGQRVVQEIEASSR